MVARIRGVGARPVILSASPVNDGTTMAQLAGRNVRLSEYATALKAFSAKEGIPYADQFHALVDVWGKNKLRENILALKPLAADDSLAGVEHLRAFLAAQEKQPVRAVSMLGDPVHPGAPGQLMMAAALLKRLGADGFVSSAEIDAPAAVSNPAAAVKAKGCAVTGVTAAAHTLAFDRLDACLPFPIPADARVVLPLAPEVLALSRYTLTVTNLSAGDYVLKIEGAECGRFSAKELAAGVNLTALPAGAKANANPIAVQMQAVLAAVAAKEGVVGTWRGLSQKAHAKGADPKLMADLAALTKKVEAADATIREAAKPKKLHFEIAAAQ
jgi:hypothetical protein